MNYAKKFLQKNPKIWGIKKEKQQKQNEEHFQIYQSKSLMMIKKVIFIRVQQKRCYNNLFYRLTQSAEAQITQNFLITNF